MQPLQPNTSYHIFNHANGFENIFRHEANYCFFLKKYAKYIGPVAETYAYCLMPNHFHLVARMRKRAVIEKLIRKSKNFSKVAGPINNGTEPSVTTSQDSTSGENFGKVLSDSEIEKYLSKQFAKLFSCYTQSFNKVYHRMGSLFIKNFKREPITDKPHFLNAIVYTHRNPVHHGFCKAYDEWPFSSYNEIMGGNSSVVNFGGSLKMFGGKGPFEQGHLLSLKSLEGPVNFEIP